MKHYLFKRVLLLLGIFVTTIMSGQTITGTVSDASGPLPGANVFVKNTGNGTTTDFDGRYTLENVAKDAVVVVSFLGYTTQEINASGRSAIDIVLQEDLASLEEVVVVGYSSKSTRDITGSIEVVDVEVMQKAAPLSVEQALQGQASGVSVGAAGTPGGAAAVRVRGFSSLNGADPLYVIDGTPTGSGISDLNPADIESIQVLKDASSSAIYGNRAANGVIIVTTKKGKRNNKAKVSINTWTGIDYIPKSVFPELASPQQIADSYWQGQANANAADDSVELIPTNNLYGTGTAPVLPTYLTSAGGAQNVNLSDYSLDPSAPNPISLANQGGTDWFDEFFNTAIVHKTDISMSGGNEKSNFYVGLGVLDQDGVAMETYYNRYNVRVNSDFSASDRFRIGQTTNLSYSEQVEFRTDDADDKSLDNAVISLLRMHPLIPVYDINGGFSGSFGSGLTGNGLNPIATAINGKDNKGINLRAIGSFYAEYDLFKDLTAKSNLGYDLSSFERRTFNPSRLYDANVNTSNSLKEEVANAYNYNWFNTLTYATTFGEKHDLKLVAGTEIYKTRRKYFDIFSSGYNFENELDTQYVQQAGNIDNVTGRASKTSLFSLLGVLSYKFDDKYLIDGSIRRDGSSKFGVTNSDLKFGEFYAASAGWRVSNESFLKDSDVVTNLLLKVGYGEIGADGIPEALDQDTFENDAEYDGYSFGGVLNSGSSVFASGNQEISWETKTTINGGFDLTLFNKLDIGFEYYDTTSENLLTLISSDPTLSGDVNQIAANAGQMTNKGFDINLGYRDNTASGFNYSIAMNVSHYKNNVDFLDPNNNVAEIPGVLYAFHGRANNTVEGSPIGSFYGLEYLGVENGVAVFDVDDDDDTDDRKVIGDPHPDFTYGINFNADYKNFDFSLFLQGSQGNEIYNMTRFITESSQFASSKTVDYVNSAIPGNTGNLPLLINGGDDALAQASSYYIEDGSYVKLKSIQLGYSLPNSIVERFNMDRFRVYVQAKNLFTITDYSGLDPEISVRSFSNNQASDDIRSNNTRSFGVDSGAYPIARSIIFGINITL